MTTVDIPASFDRTLRADLAQRPHDDNADATRNLIALAEVVQVGRGAKAGPGYRVPVTRTACRVMREHAEHVIATAAPTYRADEVEAAHVVRGWLLGITDRAPEDLCEWCTAHTAAGIAAAGNIRSNNVTVPACRDHLDAVSDPRAYQVPPPDALTAAIGGPAAAAPQPATTRTYRVPR